MKVKNVAAVEAEETFKKIPERKTGHWTEICNTVKEKKQAVEVSDITHGQVAALKRKCKEEGLRMKSINKGTGALILPPEPKR